MCGEWHSVARVESVRPSGKNNNRPLSWSVWTRGSVGDCSHKSVGDVCPPRGVEAVPACVAMFAMVRLIRLIVTKEEDYTSNNCVKKSFSSRSWTPPPPAFAKHTGGDQNAKKNKTRTDRRTSSYGMIACVIDVEESYKHLHLWCKMPHRTQDWCNRTTSAIAVFHSLLPVWTTQTQRGGDTTHGGAEALMTWCNVDGGSAGRSIDRTPLVHHVPQHARTVTTRGDGTEAASGLLKQRRVGVVRVTSKTSGGDSVSAPTAWISTRGVCGSVSSLRPYTAHTQGSSSLVVTDPCDCLTLLFANISLPPLTTLMYGDAQSITGAPITTLER